MGGIVRHADELPYDNSTSGLTADDVQAALDEVAGTSGGAVSVEDDGTEVVASASTLNFGTNLAVTDDGSGQVTVDASGGGSAVRGTATIEDPDTHIDVAHGLDSAPVRGEVQASPANDMGAASKWWLSDHGPSTFRINLDAAPGAGDTAEFDWLWTPADPVDVGGYYAMVLGDSPTGYWRLGEASGTTIVDEQGLWDGTYINTPTLGEAGALTGDSDTAVFFSRSASERGDLGSPHANHAQVSIEAWIKTSMSAVGMFMAADSSGARNWQLYIRAHDTGNIGFVKIGGGTTSLNSATTGLNDGAWHHIVVTYDGSAIKLYIDGVEDASTAASGAIAGSTVAPLRVVSDARAGNYFDGHVDECALYDYALTATQVADHYAAATS